MHPQQLLYGKTAQIRIHFNQQHTHIQTLTHTYAYSAQTSKRTDTYIDLWKNSQLDTCLSVFIQYDNDIHADIECVFIISIQFLYRLMLQHRINHKQQQQQQQ